MYYIKVLKKGELKMYKFLIETKGQYKFYQEPVETELNGKKLTTYMDYATDDLAEMGKKFEELLKTYTLDQIIPIHALSTTFSTEISEEEPTDEAAGQSGESPSAGTSAAELTS